MSYYVYKFVLTFSKNIGRKDIYKNSDGKHFYKLSLKKTTVLFPIVTHTNIVFNRGAIWR